MAQHYDVSLKLLFQRSQGVVARTLFGGPVAEWLNVELPKVQNPRADLLARGKDGTLRHLELEVGNTRHLAGAWPNITWVSIAGSALTSRW